MKDRARANKNGVLILSANKNVALILSANENVTLILSEKDWSNRSKIRCLGVMVDHDAPSLQFG